MNSNQHIKDARITDYLNNAIKTTRKSYIIPIIKAMDDSQKNRKQQVLVRKWRNGSTLSRSQWNCAMVQLLLKSVEVL
jgi:hypothetical protein